MRLFTISMSSLQDEQGVQLLGALSKTVENLHMQEPAYDIQGFHSGSEWTCLVSDAFDLEHSGPTVYAGFARCLAEYVVDVLETDLIQKQLSSQTVSFDPEQLAKLTRYCSEIMRESEYEYDTNSGEERTKRKLEAAFLSYLEEYTFLNLKGYVQFRLKDYLLDIQTVVEYAVDEFLIERQYQDFIQLLKYFVCVQEIRRQAVHIYHREGNDFVVLDEEFNPINTQEIEGLVVETIDQEINLEDMIISTLITVSPKTVYIHTEEPDMQVIQTIKMIFEERAVLCT